MRNLHLHFFQHTDLGLRLGMSPLVRQPPEKLTVSTERFRNRFCTRGIHRAIWRSQGFCETSGVSKWFLGGCTLRLKILHIQVIFFNKIEVGPSDEHCQSTPRVENCIEEAESGVIRKMIYCVRRSSTAATRSVASVTFWLSSPTTCAKTESKTSKIEINSWWPLHAIGSSPWMQFDFNPSMGTEHLEYDF